MAKHLPDIDPGQDWEMFDTFRSLIDRVVIHDREGGRMGCKAIGQLSALVAGEVGDNWGKLVARGGLEPPTP